MGVDPEFGEAGTALLEAMQSGLPEGWEFDERETELLRLAARQADVNATLEAKVEEEGMMVEGSKGQPTLHPAISEARLGRQTIDRLLGKINLPAPEKIKPGESEDAASQRARKAGEARWNREERLEAMREASH